MQRSFQSSSAPELTASASGASELTASDSRNFLLREQTLGSELGSELNEKFIFRNLPTIKK